MISKTVANIAYHYALRRYPTFCKDYLCPARLQEGALKKILSRAKCTAFGRKHRFGEIKSVSGYQKRVPLARYENMKPWIDGCLKGKADHIWPGRIKYFALTSGTTSGTSKYIPVSREMIETNKKASLDCLSFYLYNTKDKGLFKGKMLFLGGSTSLRPLGNGMFAGDMSGIMSRFVPPYASVFYEPGKKLALIEDWEYKINKIAGSIKDKDIRLISGVPSWMLVLFEHLLRIKNADKICRIWKNLSLFIYGGLDFSPYERYMQDIIGRDIYYMETYVASEAFMGIQDKPCASSKIINDNGLLLMLDYGAFYEFVETEEIGKKNPKRHTVEEIELGVNYAIAVTNVNGLYSYIIGDTVKFVSKDPLRIKVTGRINDFISALGEHVITEEVEYAITQASLETGASVANYTVAPYFPEEKRAKPGHQWLIEFSKRPEDINRFINMIDEGLCVKNDDYGVHRKGDFSMAAPRIYELKEGTFYRWHKEKGQLGGQHKTPRLRNNRVMAEELIRLDHS